MTFNELVKTYIVSTAYENLESNSKKMYSSWLKRAKKLSPKGDVGTDLRKEAMKWHKALSQLEVSNGTKNMYLSILKIVFLWGEDEELIERSPIYKLKKFRSNPDKQPAYTQEEVESIWNHAETQTEKIYANFIRALFYTGCRPSELIELCWDDVASDMINIRSAKRREKGAVSRKCNIVKELLECLNFASDMQCDKRFEVFRSPTGCKLSMTIIRQWAKMLCVKAGIPYKQLRNLRSGLATAMLKSGYSLYDVQSTLGHKHIFTTEKYCRESLEDKAVRFKGL